MGKHSYDELRQWQALPLKVKILMTKQRIRDWVNYYGEDGVYVSFSGGKDSTVLLHIAREMFPNIKAVFVDTGLEYDEIRKFVRTFDNVDIIRPKMGFKKVCELYGFPLISKEISDCIEGARRYFKSSENKSVPDDNLPVRVKMILGKMKHKENGSETGEYSKMYDKSKWQFMLDAPFDVSAMCCRIMKKDPAHKYSQETGRKAITGQMASESRLRTQKWILYGCNAFELDNPVSNPIAFWKTNDILSYIKEKNIDIAPVYGNVIVDYEAMNQCEGQLSFGDIEIKYKTSGCDRTGCVLCAYGITAKKSEDRFERLARTHPKVMKAFDVVQNNGVTYREAIEWINENNGKGRIIKLPEKQSN